MLHGKVALVTGAARGIGAATAEVLAKYGAAVGVNYFEAREEAEAVCARIEQGGPQAYPVYADVTKAEAIQEMVATTERTLGPIDILVNNVGHNFHRTILEMTELEWDWGLAVNLKSQFLCSQAVLPGMLRRKSGRIINIASISGQRGGLSGDVDYSAAKAGILGFTRSLARWAAPHGVLVNAVAPGYINTENLQKGVAVQRLASLIDTIPLKRLGEPEEIGEVVALLAGPAGSYIVGEVLTVNGGVHMD
ncbi:MAG: 3-oxoacyl-ACP reductase FabG [Acidobacteria bacterium]|nr:3-oxoacyl-ACP reductase FabG [Acidobacteriota bacterium]MCI0723903.1 3-oxoacyl-ACP reductase FabG [Acidobacteriota bacterium]